jgi:hypothetical protein
MCLEKNLSREGAKPQRLLFVGRFVIVRRYETIVSPRDCTLETIARRLKNRIYRDTVQYRFSPIIWCKSSLRPARRLGMAYVEKNRWPSRSAWDILNGDSLQPGATRMLNASRSSILLTASLVGLAVPVSQNLACGQDTAIPTASSQGPAPRIPRLNVADEWEIHRRAASENYRPAYRSIFVDPGYARYCPIQPCWNGVFSSGGRPHPSACCR